MQHATNPAFVPHTRPVIPWNKGHLAGPKSSLKPNQQA